MTSSFLPRNERGHVSQADPVRERYVRRHNSAPLGGNSSQRVRNQHTCAIPKASKLPILLQRSRSIVSRRKCVAQLMQGS